MREVAARRHPRTIAHVIAARFIFIFLTCFGFAGAISECAFAAGTNYDASGVPGRVIAHRPASSRVYIGSPSIARLIDGTLVASHDEFGPGSSFREKATSYVFRSDDDGATWRQVARIDGCFWGKLFVHRGSLYVLGTTHEYGDLVIRRSEDGGSTWTAAVDATSGLLARGRYHVAPMPVVEHAGRLWRAIEDAEGADQGWGKMFRARMMSAPVDAALLNADSWTHSNALKREPAWLGGNFVAWLEGNAVVTPAGSVANILRVHAPDTKREYAAIAQVSDDGKTLSFDPETDFIPFVGGSKKFSIRFDATSDRYWTLANVVLPEDLGKLPFDRIRNTLALCSSTDLRDWRTHKVILHHPDVERHGFQYADWIFDEEDVLAAVRTAAEDGAGGARNQHDANFLTFHRIEGFRELVNASIDTAPPAE